MSLSASPVPAAASSSPPRPVLRADSRIAVLSPAGAAQPELVAAGLDRLRRSGYHPVLMPGALARGPLYFAGAADLRAADLMAAFADPTLDGILCTRGGWGSLELLPLLDPALIRAHPKVFVGYSDLTSLHAWLWNQCRLPTLHGPMVAADWARPEGVHLPTWQAAAHHASGWSVGAADGLRVLRPGPPVEGRLLGGCLALLEAALGTPFALQLSEPTVLFLEDIAVKPYQWDRMLQHLRWAGALQHVVGIVLGDMASCVPESQLPLLESACLHALSHFAGPISIGLRSGHLEHHNRTLPLGAWVKMNHEGLIE